MKIKLFLFVIVFFFFKQDILAQSFSEPRITDNGRHDKWFLELLLRKELAIPYSTVTIDAFPEFVSIQHIDNEKDALDEVFNFIREAANFIKNNTIINKLSLDFNGNQKHHRLDFSIMMSGGELEYYFQCSVIDYVDRQRIYFHSCVAKYFEFSNWINPNSVIKPMKLDRHALERHLPKLCRKCREPRLLRFLTINSARPLEEKPYLDYSSFYGPPHLTEDQMKTTIMYFRGDYYNMDKANEIDFLDLIHPYLNNGIHMLIRPLVTLHFPENDEEGLLLKEGQKLKVVDSDYQDNDPYCIIKKGVSLKDDAFHHSPWEEGEVFFFALRMENNQELHDFQQEYDLHPVGFNSNSWFMMTCYNSPLLSYGDVLRMTEKTFDLNVIR